MRLLTKSEAAFILSFATFWDRCGGKAWFWTFTPSHVSSDRQFAVAFHTFWRRFDEWFNDAGLEGLRVFERFHGGGERDGDLHAHAVFNRRFPAQAVLRWARGTGIGWVKAVKAWDGCGGYLAKYLAKEQGPKMNVRTWAALGYWPHTRVGRVEVQSREADAFRSAFQEAGTYMGARQLIAERAAMKDLYEPAITRAVLQSGRLSVAVREFENKPGIWA